MLSNTGQNRGSRLRCPRVQAFRSIAFIETLTNNLMQWAGDGVLIVINGWFF